MDVQIARKFTRFSDGVRLRFATLILAATDIASLLISMVIAFLLRFDGMAWSEIYTRYIREHLFSVFIAIALYIAIYSKFRLYRYAWRFASLEMLLAVVYANTIGLFGLVVTQTSIDHQTFPRSVLIMLWVASIVFVCSVRILLRVLSMAERKGRLLFTRPRLGLPKRRVVILGGGATGTRVLRALRENPDFKNVVIGFLDDDPRKKGVFVSNVKVLGPVAMLKRLLAENAVDEVIVALPQSGNGNIRLQVMECRRRNVSVKVVPEMRDLLEEASPLKLCDFEVEDLLRRPSVDTNLADISAYLAGKRVLVTGAGGSIGSELCRQIARTNPAQLFLLGHGENSIHQIHQSLRADFPNCAERAHYVIASVCNQSRIDQVFRKYRPEIVFHAAAHKHVPIMETNVREAMCNNVLGARYLTEACGSYAVERVVLISTDKAADPCCIMGATKWVCEELARAAARLWTNTSYITVRFGNVLGSRGSVIPVFREQIRRGGPVTVTHPDMTRYFMTIPEAVRLVLQAGAVGASGELYLLDMGEPVKIVDLAQDMIRLCGLEPDVDVQVAFTGVRPGERLHERLVSASESIEPTSCGGLFKVRRQEHYTPEKLLYDIGQLQQICAHGTAEEARSLLDGMVECAQIPGEVVQASSEIAAVPRVSEQGQPLLPNPHPIATAMADVGYTSPANAAKVPRDEAA
jgi:FlaA1/EpsC-like NDP-sugar epimerase